MRGKKTEKVCVKEVFENQDLRLTFLEKRKNFYYYYQFTRKLENPHDKLRRKKRAWPEIAPKKKPISSKFIVSYH